MRTLHAIGERLGADVSPPESRWLWEVLDHARQEAAHASVDDDLDDHEVNLRNF